MKTLLIMTGVMLLLSCNNHQAAEEQATQPVLLSHTNNKASCVYLTKDQNNDPVISWCEQDASGKNLFYMSVLDKKKNAFNNAINIPIEQNAVFMEERMPKVAVRNDGTVIAVYETSAPTEQNGFAGFMYYIQSSDKGKTWSQPSCVHQDTASGKTHSFASLARLSDGEIGACWLDVPLGGKNEGRSVKFAKTNGKHGFQHEVLLDSFACQCCRTAISSDDKGKVSILFRDLLPGSVRDISVSTSADNGNTFSKAVPFSNNNWKIDGCPENGPSVADKNNITYAAWFTGGGNKGVYYAELNDKRDVILKKQISNNSRFIQLCVLPDKTPVIVYNEMADNGGLVYNNIALGRIKGNETFSRKITTNAQASYPVVQPISNDKVVVAWKQDSKVFYTIADVQSINKPVQATMQQTASVKPDFSSVHFAVAKDLSCGMPLKAGLEDTAHYKGKIYGFCSKECKDEFMKNPKQYVVVK